MDIDIDHIQPSYPLPHQLIITTIPPVSTRLAPTDHPSDLVPLVFPASTTILHPSHSHPPSIPPLPLVLLLPLPPSKLSFDSIDPNLLPVPTTAPTTTIDSPSLPPLDSHPLNPPLTILRSPHISSMIEHRSKLLNSSNNSSSELVSTIPSNSHPILTHHQLPPSIVPPLKASKSSSASNSRSLLRSYPLPALPISLCP